MFWVDFKVSVKLFIFKVLVNLFRFFPSFLLEILAAFVTPIYRFLSPRDYKIFFQNASFIYPEKNSLELRKIARKSLRRSVDNVLFSLKVMKRRKLINKFQIQTSGIYQLEEKMKDSAVILIVPHLGINFLPVLALARKLHKKIVVPIRGTGREREIEEKTYQYLSDDLVSLPLLGGTMPKIEDCIQEKGMIILALDAILPINHKQDVDFFGSKFKMTSGPLWLADQFALPIFSVYSVLEQQKQIKIRVEEFKILKTTNLEKKLNLMSKRIEGYIHKHPGSWNLADDYFFLKTS